MYHRENRDGFEKTHDHVEKSLLIEIDNLRTAQARLNKLYAEVQLLLYDPGIGF